MAEPFNCPTCGAPLDAPPGSTASVTCPFCRSTVLLPDALRQEAPKPAVGPAEDESLVMRLRALLASGRKIDAIKLYREKYWVGLKEAKDAVEAIETGLLDSLPEPFAGPSHLEAAPDLDAFLAELQGLVGQGNKIEAIKRYRQVYGVSLKDALFTINRIETGTLQTLPSPEAEAARLHQEAEAAEQAKRDGRHHIPFSVDRSLAGSQSQPTGPRSPLRTILSILLIAGLVFALGLLAVRCSGPTPEIASPWLNAIR